MELKLGERNNNFSMESKLLYLLLFCEVHKSPDNNNGPLVPIPPAQIRPESGLTASSRSYVIKDY